MAPGSMAAARAAGPSPPTLPQLNHKRGGPAAAQEAMEAGRQVVCSKTRSQLWPVELWPAEREKGRKASQRPEQDAEEGRKESPGMDGWEAGLGHGRGIKAGEGREAGEKSKESGQARAKEHREKEGRCSLARGRRLVS